MKTTFTFILVAFVVWSLSAQIFTDSNLPIVLINTDTNAITGQPEVIVDEPKVLAAMKIIYRPNNARNYLTDADSSDFLNYNGRIGIELRGSTSQGLPKKPYGLTTLQNDNISNNNVSLLDMPAENDWILNALPYDATLIRDFLSYNLYRNLGNYSPRGHFCEVVVNGDYKGIFIFMEKIKVDKNRVDILKMTTTDVNYTEVTGGYITKCDKITGGDPVAWTYPTNTTVAKFMHESPSPLSITAEQDTFIHGLFDELVSMMNDQNASIESGFPSIIDIPSFIDFMIMCELSSNVDCYQLSTFYHKDRNGKLRAGPIWDYNLTYGLDPFGTRSDTDVWQFNNGSNDGPFFWKQLYENELFNCYFTRRWNDVTAANQPLDYNVIAGQIDDLVTLLTEARARENARWGTITNYTQKINSMKTWLQTRISWLNANISNISNCSFPTPRPVVISRIHYHPAATSGYTSEDLEFIELSNNSNSNYEISGYYFKDLGISYIFPVISVIHPHGKIYLANNYDAFLQTYGFAPYDVFTRDLSNKSQKLSLVDPYGNLVDYVEYTDSIPWPTAPDGGGSYLQLIDLNYDNALASSWIASSQPLLPPLGTYATDGKSETIVFPNPTSSVLNISNKNNLVKSCEIYDNLGRLVASNNENNFNTLSINIEPLPPNVYTLQIVLEDGSSVQRKVVKY